MVIKLTSGELSALFKYQDGPFGEKGFLQFMAGMCARINPDTGEVDIDRDDQEAVAYYKTRGHKRVLEAIFDRPIDDAIKRFMG